MRKLAALLSLLASVPSFAGIALSTETYTFTNCSSSGSTAQTVNSAEYVVSIADEGVFICIANSASTCASGGTFFNPGVTVVLTIGAYGTRSVSCRSAASTGDLYLGRKAN